MIGIDNTEAKIVGLYFYPTYRGLLLGCPHDKMNGEFIEDAQKKATDMFQGPTLVIDPKITMESSEGIAEEGHPDWPRLPHYTVLVKLETFKPEGDYDGRNLTVVFFADEIYNKSMQDIVYDAVEDVDWKKESNLWSF